MNKYVALVSLVLLTGCVSTQAVWTENIEGNRLTIKSETVKDTDRRIHIINTDRIWIGTTYSGDEEKVPARKQLLKTLSEKQAAVICAPETPIVGDEIAYDMLDTAASTFGDGILGYAIASAVSEYKNLPTGSYYFFYCPSDSFAPKNKP